MLDNEKFNNVLKAYSSYRNAPNDEYEKIVDENTDYDTFYGFLDKKTVFKVEDYE